MAEEVKVITKGVLKKDVRKRVVVNTDPSYRRLKLPEDCSCGTYEYESAVCGHVTERVKFVCGARGTTRKNNSNEPVLCGPGLFKRLVRVTEAKLKYRCERCRRTRWIEEPEEVPELESEFASENDNANTENAAAPETTDNASGSDSAATIVDKGDAGDEDEEAGADDKEE
ncbi:hypothetical protein F5B20DRAFT_498564 [Whalleya microplaca]|nr:hypothetical protein F5B20DRAFT_498564 [Whalleya microplaca]